MSGRRIKVLASLPVGVKFHKIVINYPFIYQTWPFLEEIRPEVLITKFFFVLSNVMRAELLVLANLP